jgi:hypothetical protein
MVNKRAGGRASDYDIIARVGTNIFVSDAGDQYYFRILQFSCLCILIYKTEHLFKTMDSNVEQK